MTIEDNYGENSELVIGLVAPVGVNLELFVDCLEDHVVKGFQYESNHIRLSRIIESLPLNQVIDKTSEYRRIDTLMTAGDEARKTTGQNDCIIALGISGIYPKRERQENDEAKPLNRWVHIFDSIKHPEELETLRNVYGNGFYLLAISSSRTNRIKYLTERKHMSANEAEKLISRDESESFKYGQHTSDVFHLADGFIDMDDENWESQLVRILDLIFSYPYFTPTKEEYAMFMACASALRSADLSRQIGAVIMSGKGEIIATGANDVPSPHGGLYWPEPDKDYRDYKLGYDANEKERNEIALNIIRKFETGDEEELLDKAKEKLKDTGIFNITEYGRVVHAEMEAIIACARSGISLRGATLFTTTFPCHNCAKHIIDAGISRVVYIEPYPKSHALELHPDAISQGHNPVDGKVLFEPFVGIGPRRFIDLFSMKLSSGRNVERKVGGKIINWERKQARIRVPMLAMSYIDRENAVLGDADKLKAVLEGVKNDNK